MSGASRRRDQRDSESPTAPDSTTRDRVFTAGDEVLVQRKDGNFYLGTVVEVSVAQEKCLVKFDDNTDHWSAFKHLAKLNKVDNVMCVICKKSQTKKDNEVVVCDRCSRGYHQLCHQPTIEAGRDCWECQRCLAMPLKPLRAMRKQAPAPPPAPPLSVVSQEQTKNKLPYDMDNLVWDMHHRVNSDNKYCYCGKQGDWYMKMLQCGRCRQWFHEHCLRCLQYPLYLGDQFYIFVCNLCNNGKEFLRRMEMKWVDLVHLVLFNLTVYKAKKFHDLDTDISQYVNNNWNTLQLPPKIQNVNSEDRKSILLTVLANNLSRFKCGDEAKQKRSTWGLRVRIPPLAPNFSLPKVRPINDGVLKECWTLQKRLKFLPPSLSLVSGKCGLDPALSEPPPGIKLLQIQDSPPVFLPKGLPATGHKVCIKSSFPCFPESRATIQRRIRAQGLKIQRIRNFRARKARKLLKNAIVTTSQKICQEMPLTPPSSVSASETAQAPTVPVTPTAPLSGDTSSEDTSSSRTLDVFIPPPKDFEGKNNPFRSVAELLGNTTVPLPPISLTIPLKPSITQPVLRPTKRRLSEKDIRINRNGEVKRRRLRRQCTVSENIEEVPSVCWNSAKSLRSMYNPTSNHGPDYINGKKLKKSKQKGITPTSSPIKQNPTISLDDLKTSVNIYFGAANRIASGEKFRVRAKRVTSQGRTQYLIEWGGSVT